MFGRFILKLVTLGNMTTVDANQEIINYIYRFVDTNFENVPLENRPTYYLLKAQFAIFTIMSKEFGTNYGKDDLTKTPFDDMIEKIKSRMLLGRERYGHGIRLEDDTRQWGTKKNSWLEMCEEEILDGIIYSSAHHLRRNSVQTPLTR